MEREFVIWVASVISTPYVDDYARNAVVGSLIDVYVDIDGITYRNDPRTYGSITVNESSQQYIQVYNGSSILVTKAGRCVFSVTDYNGVVTNYLVVSHTPENILSLPTNCRTIDPESFYGVAAEEVIIPSGCECIMERAFANSNIKVIYIPASVTTIEDEILYNCQNVTVICPQSSTAFDWAENHKINVIPEHFVLNNP